MKYPIKAIPTVYGGVQFRSRLEAQWASFFDLAGWKWQYEPFDLDGWAPDFLIAGQTQTLVEVKPILMFPYDEDEMFGMVRRAAGKAIAHANKGDDYEVVVAGIGPFDSIHGHAWGMIVEPDECLDYAVCYRGIGDDRLDYAAGYGSYEYRIGGQYDGDHHLISCQGEPQIFWREAGNRVQWQPR